MKRFVLTVPLVSVLLAGACPIALHAQTPSATDVAADARQQQAEVEFADA